MALTEVGLEADAMQWVKQVEQMQEDHVPIYFKPTPTKSRHAASIGKHCILTNPLCFESIS